MHDLIFHGARVADGLGNPLLEADVAVSGGRIAEIGRVRACARETVDADGLVLAPGIIDAHTHYDAQLTWDATASPSPALGVTTVIIGNCGFGIAPCPPQLREWVMRNLSEVEGMPLEVLRAGIDWGFESFPEYLDALRGRGCLPNVAVLASHSTIRGLVLGEEATARAATAAEVAAMKAVLREAIDAGAIGFASSTFENHNGHGGVAMPSRLAADDEFETLIGVLGEAGRGVFQITVGRRTPVAFLEEMARRTGRPMIYAALLHNERMPERTARVLGDCEAALGRGAEVYAQVSCQPLSMEFTLDNAYPLYGVEPWNELKLDDRDALGRAFADGAFRRRFRDSLATPEGGRLFNGDWERVEVAGAATPANAGLEGHTIVEVAAARGADPVDAFFDLALEEDLNTVFAARLLNTDDDAVAALLTHDATLISLSDAGAHLTFLCDAGFGLHLLGHWVRERGTFALTEAVRQLTSVPARIYRIPDRGRIEIGAWADLMLFDPANVGISRARRVRDLPGGGSRLLRDAHGLHGVWVNGVRVFDGADYRRGGRPPGHLLDRFDA
ncbi:MAG: amidohydrolase family protein [Alphaproteobacteria bacterium]